MSMPAFDVFFDEDAVIDPDDLKMPERAVHRRSVDVIALAATRLLGPGVRVFRDLNWYPLDGGPPMAPDVMVVSAEVVEASPTSFQQPPGPASTPTVVVEVPSNSDGWPAFRAKTLRYRDLGTVVYVVVVDEPSCEVVRLGSGDNEPVPWTDQPIPELGGLRLTFDDGELVVVLPDGSRATSDHALIDAAEQRAVAAEARVAALARQLEALGEEPGS